MPQDPIDNRAHARRIGLIALASLACVSIPAPAQNWRWTQDQNGPQIGRGAMVFDPTRGGCVVVGGSGAHLYNLLVTANGLSSFGVTVNTSDLAAAFDTQRGRLVAFGGFDLTTLTYVNRTEQLRTDGLWDVFSGQSPPARLGHRMVYDPARNEMLMFGGSNPAFASSTSVGFLDDFWSFNGTSWTQKFVAGPSARSHFGFTFDTDNQVVVLHGGWSSTLPPNTQALTLSDTWIWNGVTWSLVNDSVQPSPPRRSHGMTYDSLLGMSVAFGGDDGLNFSLSDTLYFRLTSVSPPLGLWQSFPLTPSPSPRHLPLVTFDPLRQEVVLVGGDIGGSPSGDVWHGGFPPLPTVAAFGNACTVNGTATQLVVPSDLLGLPWQGQWFFINTTPLPANTTFVAFVGFSNTSAGGIPLPADFGTLGIGPAGCSLLIDPSRLVTTSIPASLVYLLDIPAGTAGFRFFTQAAIVDATTLTILGSTNALDCVVQ